MESVDQLLDRARSRIEEIVADRRRQFLSDTAADDCDPDVIDAALAMQDAEFGPWLDGVLALLRETLIKEFEQT
jgi:hypothetical protein